MGICWADTLNSIKRVKILGYFGGRGARVCDSGKSGNKG